MLRLWSEPGRSWKLTDPIGAAAPSVLEPPFRLLVSDTVAPTRRHQLREDM